jgi:hypothetical protein
LQLLEGRFGVGDTVKAYAELGEIRFESVGLTLEPEVDGSVVPA